MSIATTDYVCISQLSLVMDDAMSLGRLMCPILGELSCCCFLVVFSNGDRKVHGLRSSLMGPDSDPIRAMRRSGDGRVSTGWR